MGYHEVGFPQNSNGLPWSNLTNAAHRAQVARSPILGLVRGEERGDDGRARFALDGACQSCCYYLDGGRRSRRTKKRQKGKGKREVLGHGHRRRLRFHSFSPLRSAPRHSLSPIAKEKWSLAISAVDTEKAVSSETPDEVLKVESSKTGRRTRRIWECPFVA